MQHHADVLSGSTLMDIQTQTYVKEYFGVEIILKNKEHPAFEQLQNAVLEVLNENYEA